MPLRRSSRAGWLQPWPPPPSAVTLLLPLGLSPTLPRRTRFSPPLLPWHWHTPLNCQPPPPSSLPRMPLPTSPPCTLPLCSPVTLYVALGSLGCTPWRSALSHPAPLLACTVAWQQLQQRCPRQCSSWCSSAGLPRLLGGRRGGPGQAPTHTRLQQLLLPLQLQQLQQQQGSRGAVRRRHRLLLPAPPPVPPLPLPCAYTARRPLLRCTTACACAPLGRALRLPAGPWCSVQTFAGLPTRPFAPQRQELQHPPRAWSGRVPRPVQCCVLQGVLQQPMLMLPTAPPSFPHSHPPGAFSPLPLRGPLPRRTHPQNPP